MKSSRILVALALTALAQASFAFSAATAARPMVVVRPVVVAKPAPVSPAKSVAKLPKAPLPEAIDRPATTPKVAPASPVPAIVVAPNATARTSSACRDGQKKDCAK